MKVLVKIDLKNFSKVVAKRMMSIKSMKPYAKQIAKMKLVSTIDLERELPYDKVSVQDIDKVMEAKLDEGKMKELHGYIDDGLSAEQIAKKDEARP